MAVSGHTSRSHASWTAQTASTIYKPSKCAAMWILSFGGSESPAVGSNEADGMGNITPEKAVTRKLFTILQSKGQSLWTADEMHVAVRQILMEWYSVLSPPNHLNRQAHIAHVADSVRLTIKLSAEAKGVLTDGEVSSKPTHFLVVNIMTLVLDNA